MTADVPLTSFRKRSAGSEGTFGIVFAALFAIIGLWPLVHHLEPRWWALALGLAFLAAALIAPDRLALLNRLWQAFALHVQKVTNPIVMAILFFWYFCPPEWSSACSVRICCDLRVTRMP